MSQSSAIPLRNSQSQARSWRSSAQPGHPRDMVADMLILIALTAAPVADNGARAHVEVRATATIQRGVTLKNGMATTRTAEVAPIARKPRDCDSADKPASAPSPDCRLIVYDLP